MTQQVSDKSLLAIIVEDDRKLAEIFARALQEAGFVTEAIEDGDLALARITAKAPTLVVLDLHLPYLSGDNILRQIRSEPHLSETLVILATADPNFANQLKEDADLVLIKPIGFKQLRKIARGLNPLKNP